MTLDKLNGKNISVFRTALQITMICTSNGTEIKFNTNPVDKASNVAGVKKEETTNNNNNNSNSDNNTGNTTPQPSSGGKLYNYNRSCPTLSRSKNIQEGSA